VFPKRAPLLIHAFIRVHFGHSEKIHSIHPLGAYTFFFLKNLLVFWVVKFWQVHFSKACWLLVDQIFYLYHYFLLLSISFSQLLQEKIRDSLQIEYNWYPWLHVMENKVCNWKYQGLHFFGVSYKTLRIKYDNARQITESGNNIFILDITSNSNNVKQSKANNIKHMKITNVKHMKMTKCRTPERNNVKHMKMKKCRTHELNNVKHVKTKKCRTHERNNVKHMKVTKCQKR